MPRKKSDNLKPVRSKSEARERGKKGGIASGAARREKKALRETMEEMLKVALKDKGLLSEYGKLGFGGQGMTMQEAISAAMISEAANGNVKAFVAIRDTVEVPATEEKEKAITERMQLMQEAFGVAADAAEDDGDE